MTGQHHRQHGGVLAGEERAVQCLFQAADLAAHGAAGQLGQGLGVALPGHQRAEHVRPTLHLETSANRAMLMCLQHPRTAKPSLPEPCFTP